MLLRWIHILAVSLLGLTIVACAASKLSIAIPASIETSNLNLIGFNENQVESIERLYERINGLDSPIVQIPNDIYEGRAKFEQLFGFPFSGPAVVQWLGHHIETLRFQEDWTVAVNLRNGVVGLGSQFFELPVLDQMYLLIHEAAHSVPGSPQHVNCDSRNESISVYQREMNLHDHPACDRTSNGAYSFQAAFLFQLYARGLVNPSRAGLLYNTTLTRIEVAK